MHKLQMIEFMVACRPTRTVTFCELMSQLAKDTLGWQDKRTEIGLSDDPGPVTMDNGDTVFVYLYNNTATERQFRYVVVPKNDNYDPFEGVMVVRLS